MYYQVGFRCSNQEPIQKELDRLYGYAHDPSTRVAHRARLNLFQELMTELVADKVITRFDTALDIGCNAGVYGRILCDLGFKEVKGIDITESSIRTANETFGFQQGERSLTYQVQNAEELDTSRQVDFILCTEVIEHTKNPGRVVDNIVQLLAPGGIAVVTLPNSLSIPFAVSVLYHRLRRRPMDSELVDHLQYPCYKALDTFKGRLRLVQSTGTNLVLNGPFIRLLQKTPFFTACNWLNYRASRLWPLKFFTQFFFLVLTKDA